MIRGTCLKSKTNSFNSFCAIYANNMYPLPSLRALHISHALQHEAKSCAVSQSPRAAYFSLPTHCSLCRCTENKQWRYSQN